MIQSGKYLIRLIKNYSKGAFQIVACIRHYNDEEFKVDNCQQ
jgi:hypothetical protein